MNYKYNFLNESNNYINFEENFSILNKPVESIFISKELDKNEEIFLINKKIQKNNENDFNLKKIEKPKKPLNAFSLYKKENYKYLKKEFPSLTRKELVDKIINNFLILDMNKKQYYINKFEKNLKSYNNKMVEFKNNSNNIKIPKKLSWINDQKKKSN